MPRSARLSGPYHRYVPDEPDGLALAVGGDLSRRVSAVERGMRALQSPDAALDELRRAEILHTTSVERGTTAYLAREVLDLITTAERALASTKFDTRTAARNRPVPARPQG